MVHLTHVLGPKLVCTFHINLFLSACSSSARHIPWRAKADESEKRRLLLLTGSRMTWEWSKRPPSGHELSLSLPSSLWWICLSSLLRSWALFNGLFQPWFARRKPLTNPFKEGSMDFMAPRALSASFNKVKSKALSIRQWARGTVDAAVFNPRDATVHCMLGCSLIGQPPCTALTWGLFSSCGRADLLLHRWG